MTPGCADCPSDQVSDRANEPVFRRVLWVALLANFAMFFVELVASQLGDSLSLQADALDFLTCQWIALAGLAGGRRHRRIEHQRSLPRGTFGPHGTAAHRHRK